MTIVEIIENEWAVLTDGNMQIALHRIGEVYRDIDKPFKAESNTKLVFAISEDLVLFREKLIERSVLMKDIKSFSGMLLCDGEDPEGNVFQIVNK